MPHATVPLRMHWRMQSANTVKHSCCEIFCFNQDCTHRSPSVHRTVKSNGGDGPHACGTVKWAEAQCVRPGLSVQC
eukprot:6475162-Alexandrium_andersonii.AAC.1